MTGSDPQGPDRRDVWRSRLLALSLAALVVVVGAAWIAAAGGVPALDASLAPGDASPSGTVAGGPASPSSSLAASPPVPASPAPASVAPSAAAPGASPAASASPSAPPLDSVFGMSGHLMWRDVGTALAQLDMLRDDGLGVVRFDVSWRGLEPARGRYQYLDKLDRIVDGAVERGIRPVISIVETPGWANGGQDAWTPPDDMADYASFAAMLAKRYAGRVDAWEIWNEPDIRLFWRPDPDAAAYARMLKAAYPAIKAANPAATVVGGAIAFGNLDYIRGLYDAGAGDSFDALSVHPYTLKRAPDDERDRFHSLTAILDDVHALLSGEGDASVPIWVTELGWAVVGLNSVSAEQRVAYLRQSVDLVRQRPWVEVVTVYTISTADSERYGLSAGGRRSAAWEAYVEEVRNGER